MTVDELLEMLKYAVAFLFGWIFRSGLTKKATGPENRE